MMKRREFLIGSCSAIALAGLGVGNALATGSASVGASAGLGKAKWQALLNQEFRLWLSSGTSLVLTLVGVNERPATSDAKPLTDQFTLTFSGVPTEPIAEGTYRMCEIMHPTDGNFFLHLQPGGSGADHALYRSDFNLLT